jgi:hypothetical protein
MPTMERSIPITTTFVLPSERTSAVAVRSLSIACTGFPKRRKPV